MKWKDTKLKNPKVRSPTELIMDPFEVGVSYLHYAFIYRRCSSDLVPSAVPFFLSLVVRGYNPRRYWRKNRTKSKRLFYLHSATPTFQWYLPLAIISYINQYISSPFCYLSTAFWCPYHRFSSTFYRTFDHPYGLLVNFLSAYLINILSVVLLVCLPYLEVFPVLTLFFFHSIAVQLLKEILSLPHIFAVVIGPGPEIHKRLVPGEIGWWLGIWVCRSSIVSLLMMWDNIFAAHISCTLLSSLSGIKILHFAWFRSPLLPREYSREF